MEEGKTRERQGGGQKSGVGENPMKRPPMKNSFRSPSPRYVLPPPPTPFLSLSPLEIPTQVTSSETISEGLQKWFPSGHPREVLLFGTFCAPPPPFSSAQEKAPTPTHSALLRKLSFAEGQFRPHYGPNLGYKGQFCGKIDRGVL